MWLMALGSATHKQSSYTHTPTVQVRNSNAKYRHVQGVTYSKRTVPTNGIPVILEESLLCPSSVLVLEIPLVSLKGFTFSAIDLQGKVEGTRLTLRRHTENPRWVHRPWYIPDCRKPPASSKKDTNEECRTSDECPELVLHRQLEVSLWRKAIAGYL